MPDTPFAMPRTCAECPWLRDTPPGKFPPERFAALEATCRPGGLSKVFGCHMMAQDGPRACAGFLLVCGQDNNRVRMAAAAGAFDPDSIEATGPLYDSFNAMVRANGYDPGDAVDLAVARDRLAKLKLTPPLRGAQLERVLNAWLTEDNGK